MYGISMHAGVTKKISKILDKKLKIVYMTICSHARKHVYSETYNNGR